ncbi:MAG: glucuronyl hydrolase, partial [Chryseobacterium sp.]
LELSTQVKDGQKYFTYAEDILKSLSSDDYLAKPGENKYFILKHSVGAFLYNSEIDTPLDYADYYYLEALKRYKEIKKIDLKSIKKP